VVTERTPQRLIPAWARPLPKAWRTAFVCDATDFTETACAVQRGTVASAICRDYADAKEFRKSCEVWGSWDLTGRLTLFQTTRKMDFANG
jgi:hypothetical protein